MVTRLSEVYLSKKLGIGIYFVFRRNFLLNLTHVFWLCLFAFAITNLGLFGGILIGNYCQNKISASLFIKIVAAIFILMFLLYIFSVYKSGTFLIYQPAYLAFSLLAWLHLIYVCSKKEQIISELLSSQEKRAYHKFVIFFFLNFMALAPFIDCSRIVVLIYFQFLHLFNVNHK